MILWFSLISSLLTAQEEATVSEEQLKAAPALIVIDIQNGFLGYMSETDRQPVMENINKIITLFHKKQLPVIRVYHHDLKYGGPQPGSKEFEFPESVCISDKDPKVIKHYEDAFNKTCLDSLLRTLKVNAVFLCGLSATGCVLGTYYGSRNHDYYVFMVKDAILSPNIVHTDVIREICSGMSYDSIAAMLNRKD